MFKTLRDSLKFLLDDDFDYDSYTRSSRDGKKIFRKLIDVLKYCQRNDEEFTSFINDCVDDFDYYDEVSIDDVKSIIILYMEYVVQTIRECKLDAGAEAYGIFDEIADFSDYTDAAGGVTRAMTRSPCMAVARWTPGTKTSVSSSVSLMSGMMKPKPFAVIERRPTTRCMRSGVP